MPEPPEFFRPPQDERTRLYYVAGFMDGTKAGRAETLALIQQVKALHTDPALEHRRQLAEVEIVEAEARIRKAVADRRELYAQRKKFPADP